MSLNIPVSHHLATVAVLLVMACASHPYPRVADVVGDPRTVVFIPDVTQGEVLSDPGLSGDDGIANSLDVTPEGTSDEPLPWDEMDEDGDGIPNGVEGTEDPDGDGLPNYKDADSDGDGILDAVEKGFGALPADSDKDGLPDYLDLDSDNDGLDDAVEAVGADGVPGTGDETNPTKKDSDGDGFPDVVEVAYGSNPLDPDSKIPPDVFYVVLPYNAPNHEVRTLVFQTDITLADVLILVDLSGSMAEEHANLKEGIRKTIIAGVKQSIPGVAFGLVTFGTWEDRPYTLVQPMTTDESKVEAAVETIAQVGGSEEPHTEVLWQAATGGGMPTSKFCINQGLFFCWEEVTVQIPPTHCPPPTVGGACFRPGAMPIFIMLSDEVFQSWKWTMGGCHDRAEAIAAMNQIGARFIGVDSSEGNVLRADYEAVALGTKSVDEAGKPFNFTIASNGTGLSDQIVTAVADLSQNVVLTEVGTNRASVENVHGVDTTRFIRAILPKTADPSAGVDSMDAERFYGVNPGTRLTFEVDFYNDVFEPQGGQAYLFQAVIEVVGDKTLLDTRKVYIVVPGKRVVLGP